MRRVLLLLLVLAVLATGCSRAARRAETARASIAIGDTLLHNGRYDDAVDAYVVAAWETSTGPVHDEALRRACVAVATQVASEPLPVQVAAMRRLLERTRGCLPPLYAHNWLCDRLDDDARFAAAKARAAVRADGAAIAAAPASERGKRRSSAETVAAGSATASASVPATLSAEATRAAVATLTPVATRATAPTPAAPAPARRLGTPADYRAVAAAVGDLGQPPSARTLYVALAELRLAMDGAAMARGGGHPLTYEQAQTLREADARLVRALRQVDALLAASD